MRIGIVCYPSIGGSGIVATELGHALASKGHEVHFISYEVPFRLHLNNPLIHFHQVNIAEYDLFRYPDYALTLAVKIAEVSKEWNLDILHAHYAIPHATSAYLAQQLLGSRKPIVVTTLHGTDITLVGLDPSYHPMVKFSMEKSDGLTAVSKSLCMQTQTHFGIQKEIRVIYNFFTPEPSLIGTKPLRYRFAKDGEKLIIHSSNFRAIKRVEDVIRIFAGIRKELSCKLLLLGSGPSLHSVKRLVREFGLEAEVYFLGQILKVDACMSSSDLLLLPSEQESFGLVALEAMAYGIPIVATDVGGLAEVVENGITGFLHDLGDIGSLTDSAIQILSNESLYQKLSKNGLRRAEEKFSVSQILPRYEEFYQSLLNS